MKNTRRHDVCIGLQPLVTTTRPNRKTLYFLSASSPSSTHFQSFSLARNHLVSYGRLTISKARFSSFLMLPLPPSKNVAWKIMSLTTRHLLFLSQNKMPYQTILSLLSSGAKGQAFFYWQGIETKINLVAPRRQTVLKNSPTRPATPCARPKDLQIANWKARTLS
ncbi:hypothetical protein AVEN_68818-1 [Araneus ventricosus]|uniref:Uncharacterized protein n=1 Tax=Araneus ventricosus TaxID=182803 RepID=A0A4Y2C514_ARAVE|nr:hypothetical protein AVEN_68818-1 [Araneus ventricosus]